MPVSRGAAYVHWLRCHNCNREFSHFFDVPCQVCPSLKPCTLDAVMVPLLSMPQSTHHTIAPLLLSANPLISSQTITST